MIKAKILILLKYQLSTFSFPQILVFLANFFKLNSLEDCQILNSHSVYLYIFYYRIINHNQVVIVKFVLRNDNTQQHNLPDVWWCFETSH